MTEYEQEMQDEAGAVYGDPRRCQFHPNVKTSSDDGMFDAPCYICEGEMNDACDDEIQPLPEAKTEMQLAANLAERSVLALEESLMPF